MKVCTRRKPKHHVNCKLRRLTEITTNPPRTSDSITLDACQKSKYQVPKQAKQADSYQEPKALHAQPPRPVLCMSLQ